jgi:CheY-like chemotaxis protein
VSRKVLFVDDEPALLDDIRRTMGQGVEFTISVSPQEALKTLASQGPFAVVVSDMRMPQMSGPRFLAETRRVSPETVRMILTAQADLDATIRVVNEGNVFRFLIKPCPPDVLRSAVLAGLEQYRLVRAEKDVLEQTLAGAVQVLTDILAIVDPEAYSRASRIRRYAEAMATALGIKDSWLVRLAAMFSQIGYVAVPKELVARVQAGQRLDPAEKEQFERHREVAARLLSQIPRLKPVAAIVAGDDAQGPDIGATALREGPFTVTVGIGRQLLDASTEFDRLVTRGLDRSAALERLREMRPGLPGLALEALRRVQGSPGEIVRRAVKIAELTSGMVLDEHVETTAGLRLVSRGQEVTPSLIARLRNFAHRGGLVEPVRVLAPIVDRASDMSTSV